MNHFKENRKMDNQALNKSKHHIDHESLPYNRIVVHPVVDGNCKTGIRFILSQNCKKHNVAFHKCSRVGQTKTLV